MLLLGGLGFIGLNLVPELLRAGTRVEIVNRSLDPLALRWLDRQAGGREVRILTLFGGGRQLRDYLHVADAVAAVLRALVDERAAGETLNVGAGTSVSLREMAERIVEACGSGRVETAPWPDGYQRVETGDFLCDTRRAERLLSWRPGMDLDTGLRSTVGLYRELLAEEQEP